MQRNILWGKSKSEIRKAKRTRCEGKIGGKRSKEALAVLELFILAISFLSIKCCRKSQSRTHTQKHTHTQKQEGCPLCACVCTDANHMHLLVTFYERALFLSRAHPEWLAASHSPSSQLILCVCNTTQSPTARQHHPSQTNPPTGPLHCQPLCQLFIYANGPACFLQFSSTVVYY